MDGCGAWFGTELDAVLKSPHKSLLVETGAGAEVVTGAGESKSKRISEWGGGRVNQMFTKMYTQRSQLLHLSPLKTGNSSDALT